MESILIKQKTQEELFKNYNDLQILKLIPLVENNLKDKNIYLDNFVNLEQKKDNLSKEELNKLDKTVLKGVITRKEQELVNKLYEQESVQKFLLELKTLSLKYSAGIHETETKLNILNEDLKVRNGRSPIEHIETRLKKPDSILKKMIRNDVPFTVDSMQANIKDIAGVRIICSFKSDIFELVNIIKKIEEFEVIREKDYVTNPKPSGYRSYHIILKVPVQLSTGKEYVFVEIQIRTIAMDFWASLEHQINYKYDGVVPLSVRAELIECSKTISEADEKMMNLSEKVKNLNLN